jgi:hypothetical protein
LNSVHRFDVLTRPGWGLKLDRFERKVIVDRFNALAAELEKFSDYELGCDAAEDIREKLDFIWYKELDPIAEAQVDPIRVTAGSVEVRVFERKVLCEGDFARFMGKVIDELDNSDELNVLISWRRLDLCNPQMYGEVASFWGIDRPQDMQAHDEYWVPYEIHDA